MKHHIRTAHDTLVALNFKIDHADRQLRCDRWIFTHANAPDQPLRLGVRMSQAAVSKVLRHAEAIVGLAHTETDHAQEKARRDGERKRREAMKRERERESHLRLTSEKEARIEAARRRQYARRQDRGELTTNDRLAILGGILGEWISPERIADELCLSDRIIRDAINNYALDAHVHGKKQILCKIADVAAWVKAGCPTAEQESA